MKKLFFAIPLILFSLDSYAVSQSEQQNSINLQNQIIQRHNNFEKTKSREEKIENIKREHEEFLDSLDDELEKEAGKVVQDLSPIQCFRIHTINFLGSDILSDKQKEGLIDGYINKCLTLEQISNLGKKTSNFLSNEGYSTTQVEILPQNLKSGVLNIKIIESHLEDLRLNQDGFFDKTQKFMAFGSVDRGEILNIKPIEQGVDQMNRLRSNNAIMKVIPGKEKGGSVILIENDPRDTLNLGLSYDNNGSKLTGSRRETVSLSQDNLLKLNDNLSITRIANDLDSHRSDGGSNYYSAAFSVPFAWYNLSLSYSNSKYFFWQGEGDGRYKSEGNTSTREIALDRILIKNKKLKLSLNTSLTSRYNRSFVDGVKIEASSRKASIGSVGLSNTFFFQNATLIFQSSYKKGLNILGAKKDPNSTSSNSAHAEFDIFEFYSNYSQNFFPKIVSTVTPISYNLTFDSQVSKQRLYGYDQFSVGGVYSVRGFKDGSISADSGYNIRNELSVNLGRLIIPHLNLTEVSWATSQLQKFTFSPFYDYGYIRSKGGSESGRLSGAGFKLGFNHKNFNAALSFSWAVSKSELLLQNHKENNAVYFVLSSNFSFF